MAVVPPGHGGSPSRRFRRPGGIRGSRSQRSLLSRHGWRGAAVEREVPSRGGELAFILRKEREGASAPLLETLLELRSGDGPQALRDASDRLVRHDTPWALDLVALAQKLIEAAGNQRDQRLFLSWTLNPEPLPFEDLAAREGLQRRHAKKLVRRSESRCPPGAHDRASAVAVARCYPAFPSRGRGPRRTGGRGTRPSRCRKPHRGSAGHVACRALPAAQAAAWVAVEHPRARGRPHGRLHQRGWRRAPFGRPASPAGGRRDQCRQFPALAAGKSGRCRCRT